MIYLLYFFDIITQNIKTAHGGQYIYCIFIHILRMQILPIYIYIDLLFVKSTESIQIIIINQHNQIYSSHGIQKLNKRYTQYSCFQYQKRKSPLFTQIKKNKQKM